MTFSEETFKPSSISRCFVKNCLCEAAGSDSAIQLKSIKKKIISGSQKA